MTFKPGQSGNPEGRPKGARNRATLAAERLLDGEADTLTRKAIQLAQQGDTTALRLCIDRIHQTFQNPVNRSAVQSNHRCHSQNAQAIKMMAA
jgi:hypothetical protein